MSIEDFRRFRDQLNARILSADNLEIRRFFALDSRAYEPGALPTRTKELLGLVASLALRSDDCVTYHLAQCLGEGVTENELFEAYPCGNVVGGSIVIPHLRRAVHTWDELTGKPDQAPALAGQGRRGGAERACTRASSGFTSQKAFFIFGQL